jgi:hypothetical protein
MQTARCGGGRGGAGAARVGHCIVLHCTTLHCILRGPPGRIGLAGKLAAAAGGLAMLVLCRAAGLGGLAWLLLVNNLPVTCWLLVANIWGVSMHFGGYSPASTDAESPSVTKTKLN